MPLRAGALLPLLLLTACFVTDAELEAALDRDGDGFLPVEAGGEDCDETRADVRPDADEVCGDGIDNDCDGVPDDDGIGARTWYRDADDDGFGVETEAVTACREPEGYAPVTGDCRDDDAAYNPAVEDLCDGEDQDCDGIADDEVPLVERWFDGDGDGFGTADNAILTCEDDPDYVALVGDCDDTDPTISPAAVDLCDGIDQNCDGQIDENAVSYTQFRDDDGDGFGSDGDTDVFCEALPGYAPVGGDCNDGDATISPVAVDLCDDADQNCNGLIDEDAVFRFYYFDGDGDGAGLGSNAIESCGPVQGYAIEPGDCDDTDPGISPLLADICDGIDQDCDGQLDDDALQTLWFADTDGDGSGDPLASIEDCAAPSGFVQDDDDCDDDDPGIRPGATDLCDSVDQDCDGAVDEDAAFTTWFRDGDGDGVGTDTDAVSVCDAPPSGYVAGAGDCDDGDAAVVIPSWYLDGDGDGRGAGSPVQVCAAPLGHVATDDDCDDGDPARSPAFPEVCQTGVDEDCDAATDCRLSGFIFLDDPSVQTWDLPVDTDTVEPIGDVRGDSARDFLLIRQDGTSAVIDGGNPDFFDTDWTLSNICNHHDTADLTGDGKEELLCREGNTLFFFSGSSTGPVGPAVSVILGGEGPIVGVPSSPGAPAGVFSEYNDELVFADYSPGFSTMLNRVVTTFDFDGLIGRAPACGSSSRCISVWTLDAIHVFQPTTSSTLSTTDALWTVGAPIQAPALFSVVPIAKDDIDVDGDGVGDMVWQEVIGSELITFYEAGPLTGASAAGAQTNAQSGALPVGDFDADGRYDHVYYGAVSTGIAHEATGPTAPQAFIIETGYDQSGVRFADVNGDGYDDYFIVDGNADQLLVVPGNGP